MSPYSPGEPISAFEAAGRAVEPLARDGEFPAHDAPPRKLRGEGVQGWVVLGGQPSPDGQADPQCAVAVPVTDVGDRWNTGSRDRRGRYNARTGSRHLAHKRARRGGRGQQGPTSWPDQGGNRSPCRGTP